MKIYKLGLLAFFALFLFSCDKETEGLSKITYYATFDMSGDNFVFVKINSPFTDPGVTATEDGKPLTVSVKGSVDTSTPGVYVIQYSAVNSDGLASSVSRRVAVVNDFPTVDLSGPYQYVGRTQRPTVTKNGGVVGYYRISDSWFQASAAPFDFLDMGDGTLFVFPANTNYGPIDGTGAILPGDQISFSMRITAGGNAGYTWAPVFQKL